MMPVIIPSLLAPSRPGQDVQYFRHGRHSNEVITKIKLCLSTEWYLGLIFHISSPSGVIDPSPIQANAQQIFLTNLKHKISILSAIQPGQKVLRPHAQLLSFSSLEIPFVTLKGPKLQYTSTVVSLTDYVNLKRYDTSLCPFTLSIYVELKTSPEIICDMTMFSLMPY